MNNEGTAVGIDLSHSRQKISTTNFIDEFAPIFDDVELTYLQSILNVRQQYIAFNHIWTLKESFTKLLGSGLNIDLSQFCFLIKEPLELVEPSFSKDLISEYSLDWNDQIDINVDKLAALKNKFLVSLPDRRFTCVSSVLRTNEELPVIVSIIHQHEKLNIRSYNINMLKVLSST
jgi:4'-phosphopantetheinyl transferase